jgi:hypothetical protein
MLTREFTYDGHKIRFTITPGHAGWDVRQERDNTLVRTTNYRDWHRVERAIQIFEWSHRQPAGPLGPAN